MPDQEREKAIEERLGRATEPPWCLRINGCTASILTRDGAAIALLQQVRKPQVVLNAAFIAGAPADVRYLLDELKAERSRSEEMRELLEQLQIVIHVTPAMKSRIKALLSAGGEGTNDRS